MNTTFLNRIEIQNQEYVATKAGIETAERNIIVQQQTLDELEPVVKELHVAFDAAHYGSASARAVLEDDFRIMFNTFMFQKFPGLDTTQLQSLQLEQYVNFVSVLSQRYRNLIAQKDSASLEIHNSQNALAKLREKIVDLDPDPTIYIKDQIDEQLMQVEGVVPGSVFITKQEHALVNQETLMLHWKMESGMSMVNGLDGNRFPQWFHVDEIEVPFGNCEVRINLNTKQCQIVPLSSEEAYYTWQGCRNVHPHILESNKPCFGDFSGPYTEALAEQRWVDVASIIRLFLTNIDSHDSAGKHWSQYFARQFADRKVIDRHGMPTSLRGYKHYYRDDDGNWYTKLSKHPIEFQEITPLDLEELERQRAALNMRPRFTSATTGATMSTSATMSATDYRITA